MPLTAIKKDYRLQAPAWSAPTLVNFTLSITREGLVTPEPKDFRAYLNSVVAWYVEVNTGWQKLEHVAANSTLWRGVAYDMTEPKVVGYKYFSITDNPSLSIDLHYIPATVTVAGAPYADGYTFNNPVRKSVSLASLRSRAVRHVEIRVLFNGDATKRRIVRMYTNSFSQTNYLELAPGVESISEQFAQSAIDGIEWLFHVCCEDDGVTPASIGRYITISTDCRLTFHLSNTEDLAHEVLEYPDRAPTLIPASAIARVGDGLYVQPPIRKLTMQVTRDGEQTPGRKIVKLLTSELATTPIYTFWIANGYELTEEFAASVIDGEKFVQAIDEAVPMVGSIRWPVFTQDITMRFNLSDGDGGSGGPSGDPATFDAVVRVNNLPTNREVIVLQREIDGKWSLAGNGSTGEDGFGVIPLKVLPDSSVYALAVDNWGIPFQANLSVALGTVVRPSTYVGWVYEVTKAGVLPSEEPLWWAADEVNASRTIGTAQVVATRYYRPLAHGPIAVELDP